MRAISTGGMLRYNRLENVWVVSPGATVEGELSGFRQWLRTLPPFFLHVYPSSLYTFVDLIGENLFRRLPVRGVIAASEMFPADEQLAFEQAFDTQIADWYGHSEYATLAYCCRDCRGFHFYPTYGYMELLPSETEGCRRVVATSFNRLGTQFVRYDTGDLAVDAIAGCARDNFLRSSAIVGRSQETFVDSSGRRRSLFGYAFGDLDHDAFYDQIRDIQFLQKKPGCLRVRIVTNPGAERDKIQRAFEHRFPIARLELSMSPPSNEAQAARGNISWTAYMGATGRWRSDGAAARRGHDPDNRLAKPNCRLAASSGRPPGLRYPLKRWRVDGYAEHSISVP